MKLIDLTGQTFGLLTVLHQDPKNYRHIKWICACKCGSICSVRGSHLTGRRQRGCGCLRRLPEGQERKEFVRGSGKFKQEGQTKLASCRIVY